MAMTVLRDLAEPVLIARLTPRPPMTEDYYRDGERIFGWRTWGYGDGLERYESDESDCSETISETRPSRIASQTLTRERT